MRLARASFLAIFPAIACSLAIAGTITPPCRYLRGRSSGELVSYLSPSRDQQSANCTVYALRKLADKPPVESADLIASYLDFVAPEPIKTRAPIRGPWFGDTHPAAQVLINMGYPARPAVLKVLGDRNVSEVVRG